MAAVNPNLKEELIRAGIRELSLHGTQHFSVRRVAAACGVSCATPYRHFQDRVGFVAAILEYINRMWAERQTAAIEKFRDCTRKQLLETSLEYIRFLVENPHFRSILMQKDEEFDARYPEMKSRISPLSRRLVEQYCREVSMPEDVMRRKLYIVRSLIYGAALLFDNEELTYNEESMALAAYAIDREFELA